MVFGLLDWIYVFYKWFGIIVFVVMGLYDIIDVEMNGLCGGLLVGIVEDVGEISFYGLMILIFVLVIIFIFYYFWKWSYWVIGVFFIFGVFYYFFIEKLFFNFDLLGLYILVFCILGIFFYFWMLVLWLMVLCGYVYKVDLVCCLGGLIEVVLVLKGWGLKYKVG